MSDTKPRPAHYKCGHPMQMFDAMSEKEYTTLLNEDCPNCRAERWKRKHCGECVHKNPNHEACTTQPRLVTDNTMACEKFTPKTGRKDDQGKLRYDLIPPETLEALASVLTYGANKYRPEGWRWVEDANSRYYAALMRHLEAWRKGENEDPESGLPHLAHVLANATFLLCLEEKES